jgi:DNA-binding NarL/FixJ family response regulator
MQNPSVLLVEDHPLFRDGFAGMISVLRPAWRLRVAGSTAEAVDAVATEPPDMAVIDIMLPGGDGFALVERITAKTQVPCLLISGREDVAARARARQCGARGFIAKAQPPEAIVAALDAVLAGGTAFTDKAGQSPPIALSARQAEVLALLAEGHSNKEIRHRLDIAERTVRAHLTELFHMLGVHSRTQAIIRAREIGLIA